MNADFNIPRFAQYTMENILFDTLGPIFKIN